MNLIYKYRFFLLEVIVSLTLFFSISQVSFGAAGITVAGGGNGTTLCAGTWSTLTDIVITEGANADITASQTNVTFIISVPAGYQFNAAAAVSVTSTAGQDITAISNPPTSITAGAITVTFTVDATANKGDGITISGVQVRPTAVWPLAATGNITKTGGTAAMNGFDAADNCGTLTQVGYSSSTVSQPNTNNLLAGTNDNEIIRIEVVVTGSCPPQNVSVITINMNGSSDPSQDVTDATI